MILRSRVVVTMDAPPIANGAVAIDGAAISDVGTFAEVKAQNTGEVHDLGDQALLPGLINAHCHFDYTMLRGMIAPQPSFAEWIRQINARKAEFSAEDYLTSIADGFAEAKRFGTTSVVNLEAFPELIIKLARPSIRTWWCPEMIDVRERINVNRILSQALGATEQPGDSFEKIGLAPHAPYTASRQLYGEASEIARHYNLLLSTHLAESREEMEMFRHARGPLFDFLKDVGRPMDDCGHETPLSLFLRRENVNERWIVAHLNELAEDDFNLLATAEKFHIVHCPRSHRYFGHTPFALERLRRLGFNICLGTDSLASNSDFNLFSEMRELQQRAPSLSPGELLEMVTVNAARALGHAATLGRLRSGYRADLIALPILSTDDALEEIVGFEESVHWMMINGHPTPAG